MHHNYLLAKIRLDHLVQTSSKPYKTYILLRHIFPLGYLVLGLVVLLVVVESFWQLQQVKSVARLFVGSSAASPKEDLGELALSEWPDSLEISTSDIQFSPPISIISHYMPESAATPFMEDAFTAFSPQAASCWTVCPPQQPDADPEPADQNN